MLRPINSLAPAVACAAILTCKSAYAEVHPITGEKLADDQTFIYRLLDEHSSIDPQIVEDVSGSEVVRDLFEGLLNQDAEGNLVPGVATNWEVSESKDRFTFHLRNNAKWSNGDPVVAGDFVYAWRRAVDPETASPYSWFMELMSIENANAIISGEMPPESLGVSAPDNYTLEVRLSLPLPYFTQMVTHATTFPVPAKVIEEHGDQWTRPGNMVSNGAYVLLEHVPNERSVRVRNEHYWNNEETIIDRVESLVINDENLALTRYFAGELDRTEIPAGQFPKLSAEYPDEAHSFPRLCSYYYSINLSEKGPLPLKDKRIRQALSLAIDREIITDFILAGGQFDAYTFTPGATAGFEPPMVAAAEMSQAERDEMAKALIADAGYGIDNPVEFELSYNTSEGHKKIAVAIGQMWKQKLGVATKLRNMEWKTFLEKRSNQDFEIARSGWCGDYNEASTFLDLATSNSGYNDSKYSNEEVDRLMAEAKLLDDPAANYTRVEQIIAEDVPLIPIYHYASVFMLDSDVGGWPVGNVEQNWYSKDLYKITE
ncbi:MAG: peptide ABC transporter substrate-binding protein [Albidovulum sp.]|nr:peptide ABC transporter substrate-binding protein [Albidovulum sp.]